MKRESPADRQRYVLYFRGHRPPDLYPRTWVPIYWDPALAHAIVQRFLGGDEHKRVGNVLRLVNSDLTLTCEQLDDVLSTEPVSIDDELARTCLRFKMGSWDEDHSKTEEVEVVGDDGEVKVEKVKPAKAEKPKKPMKPDSFITISDWAKKWNISPADARASMRGSGLTKPDFGWAFDPKDETKIKKICGVK